MLILLVAFLASPGPQTPVEGLRTWLASGAEKRPPLGEQSFARTPLTREQAQEAGDLLWADLVARVKRVHAEEWKEKRIKLDDLEMRFDYRLFGDRPPGGRSLFISLHGGGSSPKRVNDQQWENQKRLYKPAEGVYLAPRAPNDAWDMWFQPHMDAFLERLILDAIVFEEVDPNRVYLTGYSAGGDGVYRLAPRLADRWAAAAMMAGHPGEAAPLNLRNLPFALHVGEKDAAFERNKRAVEWKQRLADLHAKDPEGYVHQAELHAGKGHWMDREDAAAIPWMARHNRNPTPAKVVWHDAGGKNASFYWLALPARPRPEKFAITAAGEGNTIKMECHGVKKLIVRLRDDFMDLDRPVTVVVNGNQPYVVKPERNILTLYQTLHERRDPGLMFCSQVEVELASK